MAENEQDNSNGSRDRATVALVDAKVTGIRDLMTAEFGFIKERIKEVTEPLAGLIADVSKLHAQNNDQERRITNLEKQSSGDRDYRRIHLPALVFAAILCIASIVTLASQIH